ncbi:acyltransferase family protein [Paraburkholderia tropica]|uniref:acyltransferase family protein n=1 Tax=Paraburkholderia tropica TaxID=92647 RepID=UPI00160CDA59|nr:acyltransferase [Paraburkholderia tropica]
MDDIEVLRAIAVIFTLVGHLVRLIPWSSNPIYATGKYGAWWAGVDLFFCISGFVIARDIIGRLEAARNSRQFWRVTAAFWIKRIFRIWPTSWLWMTVILVASLALRKTDTFAPFPQALLDFTASAIQMQNFHAWICASSGHLMQCDAAAPWWSLSLEEQFYIALPLTTLLLGKRLRYALLAIVAVQFFLPRTPASFLYYIRTDAIALGVLLAMFRTMPFPLKLEPTFMSKKKYAIPVLAVCLLLLFMLANAKTTREVTPSATGLIASISLLLVGTASYNRNYIARTGIAHKALLWVGSRSYAIYLIHWPMMDFTHAFWRYVEPAGTTFGSNYSMRFFLVWIALTAIAAELNYRFIEMPLRHRGKKIAQKIMGESSTSQRAPTTCQHIS